MEFSPISFALGALAWGALWFIVGALVFRNNARKLNTAIQEADEVREYYTDQLKELYEK